MAKLRLPTDLREFLKLLNSARVDYLLIGGYKDLENLQALERM